MECVIEQMNVTYRYKDRERPKLQIEEAISGHLEIGQPLDAPVWSYSGPTWALPKKLIKTQRYGAG